MARTLVVFYSRTGTTREAAHRLANLLDADIEEIRDPTPREGWRGFLRSAIEARRRRLPPIAPATLSPADYDLVVIGTPVWTTALSSPVRAYLERHKNALGATAFFCTCGGSGGRQVFQQLEEVSQHEPLARLVLRQDEMGTVNAELAMERFAAELEAPQKRPPREAPRPDDSLS